MPGAYPDTTLTAIQTKVRRLTRNLSEYQLSTTDLNQYINTFVVYDLPEHLRMFALRTTFSFVTNPYQDVYPTDTLSFAGATNNPLYNFQNNYLTIHPPVYIAGYNSLFSQSREQFYGIYPLINSIAGIGPAGDGVTTVFSGVINSQQAYIVPGLSQTTVGLLQGEVLFSSVDSNGNGLAMVDVPVVNINTGYKTIFGNLYQPGTEPPYSTPPTVVNPDNFVNYATGQFTVTFLINGTPTAPGPGITINSQSVPQNIALPQALCYYDNKFIVRPVPDQPYEINFECYRNPVALLNANQSPQLNEWWQYIVYGSAKKIFEDRQDLESVQMIMPEFLKQERLCLRRTIVQITNERTRTIYIDQANGNQGGSWGWGGGQF
jgi:hypothetical protein